MGVGDWIALAALGLSGWALWSNRRLPQIQRDLAELQLERERLAAYRDEVGELRCTSYKSGNSYKFTISNCGGGDVFDLDLELTEGAEILAKAERQRRLPHALLRSGETLELPAWPYQGTGRRIAGHFVFRDASGSRREPFTRDLF